MSNQPVKQKNAWGIAGIALPAGLFIGMGVGFLIDNITAGIFLGLGGGFLVMLVSAMISQSRQS